MIDLRPLTITERFFFAMFDVDAAAAKASESILRLMREIEIAEHMDLVEQWGTDDMATGA